MLKNWTVICTVLLTLTLFKVFFNLNCFPTVLFGAPLIWIGGWLSVSYVNASIERFKKFQADYVLHYFEMILNLFMMMVGLNCFWIGAWNVLVALLFCW